MLGMQLTKLLKEHWLMLSLVLITGIIIFSGDDVRHWVRYDRHGVDAGQVWRLVTGNLDHLNPSHWLLNVMGWVLVWLLYRSLFGPWVWLALLVWSSLAVGLGLYLFDTQLIYYVGLSGSLHGLFVAGAIMEIRFGWRNGGIVLLLMLAVKLSYEQFVGSLPGTTDMAGGPVVVNAHLYGAMAGALFGSVLMALKTRHAAVSSSD